MIALQKNMLLMKFDAALRSFRAAAEFGFLRIRSSAEEFLLHKLAAEAAAAAGFIILNPPTTGSRDQRQCASHRKLEPRTLGPDLNGFTRTCKSSEIEPEGPVGALRQASLSQCPQHTSSSTPPSRGECVIDEDRRQQSWPRTTSPMESRVAASS